MMSPVKIEKFPCLRRTETFEGFELNVKLCKKELGNLLIALLVSCKKFKPNCDHR